MNKPESPKNNNKSPFWLEKDAISLIKRDGSRIKKWIFMKWITALTKGALIKQMIQEWKSLGDYQKYIQECNNFLREGSVIWNPLYYPWDDEHLGFHSPSAWLWSAYDFKTTHVVEWTKVTTSQIVRNGKILFFPIEDELVNTDSSNDDLTPDGYFNFFDFNHFVHMTVCSISDVIEYWAMRETTYWEVLVNRNQEKFLGDAEEHGILDKKVFQVTPKWNGLVHIFWLWWDKSDPMKDSQTQWEEHYGELIPAYISVR